MENLYREEDGEWITDPTQILYAANELYPGKPNTHGLKGFFFQTLNWHWHEPSQTLRPGIHPPFWASSGEPARSTASIQQDAAQLPHLGGSTQAEELHWEESYHRRRLMYQAIDAILNRVGPEVMRWLEGGPKPTRRLVVSPSDRPQTRANSRALHEIASSLSRPPAGRALQYGEGTSVVQISDDSDSE